MRKLLSHPFVALFVLHGSISLAPSVDAQQDDRQLWRWSPAEDHHRSVVMVRIGAEVGASETGTGVVVYVDRESPQGDGYLGFIATASHLFSSSGRSRGRARNEIRIHFGNRARDVARQCSVVRHEEDLDVAIVWAWIPKDVPAARLARRRARRGDKVEFVGLGGKTSLEEGLRHFTADASAPTDDERIYADQPLLPGDSGGPIFNDKGHLLGIISGGWFWWSHETVRTKYDQPLRATWPARGSNAYPLALLIADLPSDRDGRCTASARNRSKYRTENGVKVAVMPVPRRQVGGDKIVKELNVEPAGEWIPNVEQEIIYETVLPGEIIEFETDFRGGYIDG